VMHWQVMTHWQAIDPAECRRTARLPPGEGAGSEEKHRKLAEMDENNGLHALDHFDRLEDSDDLKDAEDLGDAEDPRVAVQRPARALILQA
jgi:hypothetical protein